MSICEAGARFLLSIYAPFRIAYQLIDLYCHLRLLPNEHAAAQSDSNRFAELLTDLPDLVEPFIPKFERKREKWNGRGIVIVAGGPRYGALALELVMSLLESGCALPIEIFHIGAEEADCEPMKKLATIDGVTLRDLLSGQPGLTETPGFGYAAKPLALAASRFEEALLLDADNFVLSDPTSLFECAPYKEHGAIFWCDMYAANESFVRLCDPWNVRERPGFCERFIQDYLDAKLLRDVRIKPDATIGLKAVGLDPSEPTHESGQLLLHKGRCTSALAAVTVLNSNAHRPLVYKVLHGDKDTFRCAFAAVKTAFYTVPVRPMLGGDEDAGAFFDTCFVQPHPVDVSTPLFLHYCGRHRDDDNARSGKRPKKVMTAEGRPFRLWPFDGRRGYMQGKVEGFPWNKIAGNAGFIMLKNGHAARLRQWGEGTVIATGPLVNGEEDGFWHMISGGRIEWTGPDQFNDGTSLPAGLAVVGGFSIGMNEYRAGKFVRCRE